MKNTVETVPDSALMHRVEVLADRTHKSKSDVLNSALRSGLDWQEDFVDRVMQGIEAADRGDFAPSEEIDRVFNKYRPA